VACPDRGEATIVFESALAGQRKDQRTLRCVVRASTPCFQFFNASFISRLALNQRAPLPSKTLLTPRQRPRRSITTSRNQPEARNPHVILLVELCDCRATCASTKDHLPRLRRASESDTRPSRADGCICDPRLAFSPIAAAPVPLYRLHCESTASAVGHHGDDDVRPASVPVRLRVGERDVLEALGLFPCSFPDAHQSALRSTRPLHRPAHRAGRRGRATFGFNRADSAHSATLATIPIAR